MLFRRSKAYFQDLRERVFALADAGDAVGEIAQALCVSVLYVSKALSRRRDTGERSARPQRCHVPPKLAALYDTIRAEVASRVPSRRWWKLGLTPSPLGKDIGSSREVNAFGAERFGERLPAVDLAHVDLA
jgi:transposase